MSDVDDLIAELAPNGAEFRTLDEIATTVPGLAGKSKADFSDGNARYVSYKNAFANLSVNQAADDFVKIRDGERQNRLRLGDVVITGSSESLEDVGMSSVVGVEPAEPLYLNSFCFAVRFDDASMLLPGYSKHLFRAHAVRSQIRRAASGVTRINISKPRFMKVRIPVPPVAVQREVTRILDQFTQLEAELEAELEARRRQYEHYKHALLAAPDGVDRVTVGDVCRVFGGAPFRSEHFNEVGDGLPLVRIRDINSGFSGTFYSGPFDRKYCVRDGDILIGMDGDFRTVRWDHGDALLNQRVSRLQDFVESVDSAFVFYLVREEIRAIQGRTQASTVKHLSGKQIASIEVPLVPLEDQLRRSSALDRFDAIVSDRRVGIPAELEARQKQYEYFRDKLLTFERPLHE